ncbi:hemin uptake protein HemP [Limnobacter parvus]|uniref:Hemin uptake protein HemP n=1 Tax=Limnobacter parvus TaxID=2939690 RepID=A0ABT1XE13_9BURK|nr:hemin uptake protein HemP [Limnobacter parvus]MCR2745508.1 hemin uptake protein HemP [Limnobacter parvus]
MNTPTSPNKTKGSTGKPVGFEPLNTKALFPTGSKERTIVHEDSEYRLRITAQGKLILTK